MSGESDIGAAARQNLIPAREGAETVELSDDADEGEGAGRRRRSGDVRRAEDAERRRPRAVGDGEIGVAGR